jgi:hypothetical protein
MIKIVVVGLVLLAFIAIGLFGMLLGYTVKTNRYYKKLSKELYKIKQDDVL